MISGATYPACSTDAETLANAMADAAELVAKRCPGVPAHARRATASSKDAAMLKSMSTARMSAWRTTFSLPARNQESKAAPSARASKACNISPGIRLHIPMNYTSVVQEGKS